jgi:glycosyltransferase involved in cell wall biosynthesis
VYRAARRAGNEWLLLSKGFAPFTKQCPVNLALIVYDTMHDYYRRAYPNYTAPLERWYFDQSFRSALRNAKVLFTVSEFTTAEVLRVAEEGGLRCPPIITMGIGFAAAPWDAGAKDNRVLLLVSPLPHKRTDLAVAYLERWRLTAGFKGTIDCVGHLPRGFKLPGCQQWEHHGRIPDVLYQRLLTRARALVFFSEYEGFGMPPVEAALAGSCPVYSDIPASHEVMADVGYSFSNVDFGSFARAMDQALTASQERVALWGGELLRRHSWENVERRFIEGLRAAAR